MAADGRSTRRRTRGSASIAMVLLVVSLGVVGGVSPVAAAPTLPSTEGAAGYDGLEWHTETLRLPPVVLAPEGLPGDQYNTQTEIPRPEGDLAIRSVSFRLVDASGVAVMPHDAHLHHLVMLDHARPDRLCSYPPASRFAGTGMELTRIDLPEPYAYHSPVGSGWGGIYHVMNQSSETRMVSVEYTITYADASAGGFLDVEPYFFDVDGCWGDSEFPVPGDGGPGSVFTKAATYTMDTAGVAVAAAGHLHAGGIDATLTAAGGDEVCRSEARYGDGPGHGGHPMITEITRCPDIDRALSRGERLTLTTRYQNHEPIPGAMGIMTTYIHERLDPLLAETVRAAYPPLLDRAPTTAELTTWVGFLSGAGSC